MNPHRTASWMQAQAVANALAREAANERLAETARLARLTRQANQTLPGGKGEMLRRNLISAMAFVGGVALIIAGGATLV